MLCDVPYDRIEVSGLERVLVLYCFVFCVAYRSPQHPINDRREGLIARDVDYKAFIASLNEPRAKAEVCFVVVPVVIMYVLMYACLYVRKGSQLLMHVCMREFVA